MAHRGSGVGARAPRRRDGPIVVAVLGGGTSDEREVSLRTQTEVEEALRAAEPTPLDVRSVEILPTGRWRIGAREAAPLAALEALHDVDIFFLALHGGAGENGGLQGFLESSGFAYTGSGVAASALCMDKELQRVFLTARGVPVAPGRAFDRRAWAGARSELLEEVRALGREWVVKPRRNGSSFGVRIVTEAEDLPGAIEHALRFDDDVLVEARVEGIECTCGVLGNHREAELQALTPVEIRPKAGRFFDYEEKYSEGGALELCPPRSLSESVQRKVRELASLAHRELGCDGYSRSDFIVRADDVPVFLETNTLPGLTARSLLPQEAVQDGIPFPALCRRLVDLGLAARAQSLSSSSSRT